MAIVLNLLLTNIFLAGLCFLALRYGNPKGKRLIDSLNRLVQFRIPSAVRTFILTVFGAKTMKQLDSSVSYVFYERNPLTLYLYLVLAIGGYIAFVLTGYPHLPNRTLPFPYHQHIGFGLFCLSLFFFLDAACSNPGLITKPNHSRMLALFPFDGTVFKKGVICHTCKVEKPARSKHCRMCDVEVARFDHHCIWINQCVGLGNVKSFLLFLLFNNAMCLYGAYLGVGIVLDIIETEKLTEAWFRDSNSGHRFKATPYFIFVYLMGREPVLMYVTILCVFIGSFLILFTWYHWVTLMRKGMTTNEEDKLKRLPPEARKTFAQAYGKGSWIGNLIQLWNLKCPYVTNTR